MSTINKNDAIINYLLTCDFIKNSALYFNYINAKDNTKLLSTIAENEITNRTYIDGTVQRTYSVTLADFKSASEMEIIRAEGYTNENVEEMLDMQGIIDWIKQKNTLRSFPNFGENCIVENIKTTTDTPNLDGYNLQINPPLARYSITIQVDYLDVSQRLWK